MEYYSEQAKKELERRKVKAEAIAEAWEKVQRVHKKNGEDFANLAQNFKNATITADQYSANEKIIKVYTTGKDGRSYSDEYNLAKTIETEKEAEEMKKAGRLQERGAYLKPFYMLTPDEIEELCKNRAEYERSYAAELEEALNNFEEVAAELVELRKKAENLCAKNQAARYVLQSIFKESRL